MRLPARALAAIAGFGAWWGAGAEIPPERQIPSAAQVWKVVETPGFIVYGNVEDRRLKEVAYRLASLKAVLGRAAAGLDLGATDRAIPVYVFDTHRGFSSYAPGRGRTKRLGGYFATAFGYHAIAVDLGGEADYSSVYHELVHHVVGRNFGNVPLWFGEGIAVLYESFRPGTNTARIGWVSPGRLAWFESHPMLPVGQLVSVKPGDPEYNESERAGTFYLQSWLLVHDLLFGHPQRGSQLMKYLEAVHSGVPQDAALEAYFEGGAAGLDQELKAYKDKGYFPYVDISFEQLTLPETGTPRTLSRTEVLDALGFLALTVVPDEPAFARAHFDAALEVAPGDPRAGAGLGAVAAAEEHFEEAVALIEKAVAAKADDPALLLLGGHASLELEIRATGGTIDVESAPSPRIVQARAWLEKAITTDPFDDDALVAYAETFLATGGDARRGIKAFERADRINRLGVGASCDLLELYVRTRDRVQAEAFYASRIHGVAGPKLEGEAADTLLRLDYDDARDAIEKKDYARGLALMVRVRDEARGERLRSEALRLIPQLEAAVAATPKKKVAATAVKKR